MSEQNPPTFYFTNINYNSQFFIDGNSSISQSQLNNYLLRIGSPTSIATNTTFTGTLTTNGITNTILPITTTDLTVSNVIQGTALNSNNVLSQNNNANATHYLTYTDLSTNGYGMLQKHATLSFNPNTEIFTVDTIDIQNRINIPTGIPTTSNSDRAVNSAWVKSLNYAPLDGANAWTGNTNTFNSFLPTSTITPSGSNQLCNKSYVDTKGGLTLSNAWSGTNTFNSFLPSSTIAPTTINQFCNKTYVDTKAGLTLNNTFSGTQTINNNLLVNVSPITGSILLQYDDITMFEMSQYSVSAPFCISPGFSQITFNYSPVFKSNVGLDGGYTFGFGTSGYGAGYLQIGDGSLSILTGGGFFTDTIEPYGIGTDQQIYSTLDDGRTVTFGNSGTTNALSIQFATTTFNRPITILSNITSNSLVVTPTQLSFLNNVSSGTIGQSQLLNGYIDLSTAQASIGGIKTFTSLVSVKSQYIHSSFTLTTGTTLSIGVPIYEIYPLAPTSNLTITLPTPTISLIGVRIQFRRTGGTATVTIISATSNIYPNNSLTLTSSIMASGVYTAIIYCTYITASTYGWFFQ